MSPSRSEPSRDDRRRAAVPVPSEFERRHLPDAMADALADILQSETRLRAAPRR